MSDDTNTQQGDAQQGDTQQGDTQQGDTQQGDTQQGDTQQGNAQQGNAQQGDTQQGDTQSVDPYADLKVDLPDNMVLDEEGLGEFKALAAKHGIAPEAAQALMDLYADRVDGWAADAQARADAWADETRADPEIGGAKLEEALKAAGQARAKFGSKELDALLDTTGVGNHPAVVKFFVAIGRAISEDSIETGAARGKGPLDAAKILYPNLN